MNKLFKIFIEGVPVVIMILLIPWIKNDYILSAIFLIIIAVLLKIKYEKKEYVFLIWGFIIMIIVETIFISTGVETFERNSLLGIMPIWLPILWAYGFIAIKRAIEILR